MQRKHIERRLLICTYSFVLCWNFVFFFVCLSLTVTLNTTEARTYSKQFYYWTAQIQRYKNTESSKCVLVFACLFEIDSNRELETSKSDENFILWSEQLREWKQPKNYNSPNKIKIKSINNRKNSKLVRKKWKQNDQSIWTNGNEIFCVFKWKNNISYAIRLDVLSFLIQSVIFFVTLQQFFFKLFRMWGKHTATFFVLQKCPKIDLVAFISNNESKPFYYFD